MNRRNFIKSSTLFSSVLILNSCKSVSRFDRQLESTSTAKELAADIVIIGAGLGGCATAMAACRNGLRVILTEETDWIGGQLSQQGVPPDEHQWIETNGRRFLIVISEIVFAPITREIIL